MENLSMLSNQLDCRGHRKKYFFKGLNYSGTDMTSYFRQALHYHKI